VRQRGRDDRLIERSEEERDHDRAVDRQDTSNGEAISGRLPGEANT